ncbi:MAG: hypothetical protein GXY77_11635 [Fibrobacter sp.]|nr:hypothetical protein [Fibrobacter sp.]
MFRNIMKLFKLCLDTSILQIHIADVQVSIMFNNHLPDTTLHSLNYDSTVVVTSAIRTLNKA